MLLVGQTSNLLTFERRKNALSTIYSSNQVTSVLKDKAEILKTWSPNLLGKPFREEIIEAMKAKKESLKALKGENPMASNYHPRQNAARNVNRVVVAVEVVVDHLINGPFARALHPQQAIIANKEEKVTILVQNAPLLKNPVYLKLENMEDLTHVHPVVKSLFMGLEIPHPVPLLAGRLKHFLPAWEK